MKFLLLLPRNKYKNGQLTIHSKYTSSTPSLLTLLQFIRRYRLKMNDNSNNLFVNLSHILLQEILKNLEANIDRITLTLVCKRFYNDREFYLVFNTQNVPITSLESFKTNRTLLTHQKQMEYSLNIKSKCTAMLCTQKEKEMYSWINLDYFVLNGEETVPKNVYFLQFGDTFNQPLEELNLYDYDAITRLHLPHSFNQKIRPNTLPKNLKILTCGKSFNQVFDKGDLPDTLEELSLGFDYCQTIQPGVLPPSLTHLSYSHHFLCQVPQGVLTSNITKVSHLPINYLHMVPPTVQSLRIISLPGEYLRVGAIPDTVTDISFGPLMQPLAVGMIPPKVKILNMNCLLQINDPVIGTLPNSIVELDLGSISTAIPRGYIPESVEKLKFGILYKNRLEVGVLPQGLKYLEIGDGFNCPLDPGLLPSTLETLRLGSSFTYPLVKGSLPPNLKFIKFGYRYTEVLSAGVLPPITTLQLGAVDFLRSNPIETLPESISTLIYTYGNENVCRRISKDSFLILGNKLQSRIANYSNFIEALLSFESKTMWFSRS